MHTGQKFQFVNDRWLAVEKDDGQVLLHQKPPQETDELFLDR